MMDCSTARDLLNHGLLPGARTPQRAALGFHLAECAACRAHRAAVQARVLGDLLAHTSVVQPPAPSVPHVTHPASGATRVYPLVAGVLWHAGLAALAAIALLALFVVGSAARSTWHIHQNVQAMIVPTPPVYATASVQPVVVRAPASIPQREIVMLATPTVAPTPAPAQVPTSTSAPTAIAPAAGDAVTVLLLGVDQRPGETAPPHTDAIIIARIEPQNNRIAMLSLPRDLIVPIPGFAPARINAAYILGQRYRVPGGGVELARQTVSSLLDTPIDYYILIDFQGFMGAIDSLGGVQVDVERELYDARFPTMDYGYTVAHFLPGPQQLDGAQALMFSRIRHPDSDFARIKRQQQVLLGVIAQLRANGAGEQLAKLDQVTTALRDYVRTDMPEERIVGLAWTLRNVAPEQVERYAMRPDQVTFGIGTDKWAELAKPGVIETLAAQLMGN